MSRKAKTIEFKGGLNTEDPFLEMKPGECLQLFNYELTTLGRYRRIQGYERLDGQPSPAEAQPGITFDTIEEYRAAKEILEDGLRTVITAVPGEGPIRGVVQYAGSRYAFRDNVGATACVMWRATPVGWVVVATPVLNPGGQYEFRTDNFHTTRAPAADVNPLTGAVGGAPADILVGVDGANDPFTFDGTTFTQINTGMGPGVYPTHLEVSGVKKLYLGFANGSFLFSRTGDPTDFTVANGAGEIATGDPITGLQIQANNTLAIFGRGSTKILYGSVIADFELTTLSRKVGAIEWSIQQLSTALYIDDRGPTALTRVQSFGNFEANTIAKKVAKLARALGDKIAGSTVVREKNQFRILLIDGSGITFTFNENGLVGVSTFQYGFITSCTFSGEDTNGREVLLAGGADGFVYQIDKGTSFDGEEFTSVCRPTYYNYASAVQSVRFHKLTLEVDCPNKTALQVVPEFDYAGDSIPAHPSIDVEVLGGGGYWDSAVWDESTWFTAAIHLAEFYIQGLAQNMSPVIFCTAKMEEPHTLNSMVVEFSPRARKR